MQTSSRIKESHTKGMPMGLIACAWGNYENGLGRNLVGTLLEEVIMDNSTPPTHTHPLNG